eukprot:gene12630-20538_t
MGDEASVKKSRMNDEWGRKRGDVVGEMGDFLAVPEGATGLGSAL